MSAPRTATSWISERQAQAQVLQERARSTGSSRDARAWEQYARRTAQMQAVSGKLETAFRRADSPYRLIHGKTIQTGGHKAYLEHLVAGPGGIYLIENLDQEDPDWVRDLERNIAFFRQVASASFACLVITREPLRIRLPDGAHVVDSVEIAIEVIRRDAELETPAVVDEVWHMLDALAVAEPVQPTPVSGWRRLRWQECAFLGAAYFPSLLLAIEMPDPVLFSLFMGLIVFLLPASGVLWLIARIKQEPARQKVLWTVLIVTVVFDLLLFLGFLQDSPNG